MESYSKPLLKVATPSSNSKKNSSLSFASSKYQAPMPSSSRSYASFESTLKLIPRAASFKSHKSMLILTSKASSIDRLLPSYSIEGLINFKYFLLKRINSSPILQEVLRRMDGLESRLLLLTIIDLSSHFSTDTLSSDKEIKNKSSYS